MISDEVKRHGKLGLAVGGLELDIVALLAHYRMSSIEGRETRKERNEC